MTNKNLAPLARSKFCFTAFFAILLGSFSAADCAESVSLAWNASSGAKGYRILYGTSGNSLTQLKDVGNVLIGTISGLTAGKTYYFDVIAYNAAGKVSAPSNKVSMTASASPTPRPKSKPIPEPASSLFSSSDTPATITENDSNGVELGVKFRTSSARHVVGFRFYKGPQNRGYHTGNLWNSAGALLASAVFTHETSSGWQQVSLVHRVMLTPGTTYIVSYYSPGYYSVTYNYFADSHVSGSLTALASAQIGGNGVYSYSASTAFPRNSYRASNYWVDVLLE